MAVTSKRAEYLARVSLAVSVVFFIITLLVGLRSDIFAVFAVSWLVLSSVLVWFVLCLHFYQRSLAEQEKLDLTQLAKDRESGTIFQAGEERAKLFAVAQQRLRIFEKWFIPIFSGAIAVYQLAIGLYLLKVIPSGPAIEPKQPLLAAIFMTAIAFVSFLVSRYATGMSGELHWKPLRAGGSFLLGVAVLCFALAVGLALAHFQVSEVIIVMSWVTPILLVVLGAEIGLNVVLDIYRPRLKDQYSRAAFDSRLLGTISEPGGIFRSVASAIDYQFGFEVSQTWFYKLLERAIAPLLLFALAVLYLLSCFVVVAPNEEAIIEHFGNPSDKGGNVRLAGPGLTIKWPWPIDVARKYPTKVVRELSIGFVPKVDEKTGKVLHEGELLWGMAHYEEEYHLLVASGQTGEDTDSGAVPVSLVVAAVPVHYRVRDLYSFLYNHNAATELLEAICYRELTKFGASARIEADSEADLEHSLLGAGRSEAKEVLTREIQRSADEAGLGVEIVFVGLQGVHPPTEVAEAYQEVTSAVQEKQALILAAHAERNDTLSMLAGSVGRANELYALAVEYEAAEDADDAEKIASVGKELDRQLSEAKGDIFSILTEAQSYAFGKAAVARGTGERFAGQVEAFRAAKEIYVREQRLAALEKALKTVRKIFTVADREDRQITIVDLQGKPMGGLLDVEVPVGTQR
ncbi:MAG: SPFH domain-containing protein [Planctomycetota bacterium]|jgi:regulator of protease activity HflC (stomatin/prohibitin superfamily)